jgi:hypothetical protein
METRSFQIENEDQHRKLLLFIKGRTPPYQVDVGPIREQRSLSQNSLLWKLHTLVAAATGNTVEDMHEEALCRYFGYNEVKMPTGWIKRVPLKRSSAREKKEFSLFLQSTEAWYASEFGIWLDSEIHDHGMLGPNA